MKNIIVVGGGLLGLATARALLRGAPDLTITILEKEPRVGQHQSGRNSGVLHAGLHYRSLWDATSQPRPSTSCTYL